MKRLRIRAVFVIAAIFFSLLIFSSVAAADEAAGDTAFDIYTTDPYGNRINSFYDAELDRYYIFLPNRGKLEDMVLYTQGVRLRGSSRGIADRMSGTVTGAFTNSMDAATLTDVDGKVYNITVFQSSLPSVTIDLGGTGLEKIHEGTKDIVYTGNKVLITGNAGETDVLSENVQLKGRGNTTWTFPDKKGYQIKFEDRTKVLGMPKARKWLLLANAFDDSMQRNKVSFYLSEQLGMIYTPRSEYADLWIDGEYRGCYLLSEKPEIADYRLNLTDEKGVLMEHDDAFFAESEYWFEDEILNRTFTVSDTVSETFGAERNGAEGFKDKLDAFLRFIFESDSSQITLKQLSKYIDVDSFAKWYLANEYLLNVESFTTSFYWYTDGPDDVLHLGPVWDFDSSMGNKLGFTGTDTIFGTRHLIFNSLMTIPDFYSYVDSLYENNKELLKSLSEYVGTCEARLEKSAYMNYIKWKWLGSDNQKPDMTPFAQSYGQACKNLSEWLDSRYEFYETTASRWFWEE